MAEKTPAPGVPLLECLKTLGISSLCEWDVLVFVSRRGASLVGADHISRLLGWPSESVGTALNKLESQKLIRCSRSFRGLRLYESAASVPDLLPERCFRQLIHLAGNRRGRLLLIDALRQEAGMQPG